MALIAFSPDGKMQASAEHIVSIPGPDGRPVRGVMLFPDAALPDFQVTGAGPVTILQWPDTLPWAPVRVVVAGGRLVTIIGPNGERVSR